MSLTRLPFRSPWLACSLLLAATSCSTTYDTAPDDWSGPLRTREVTYRAGDLECVGYLAQPPASAGPRPGVIVVHEWWGHNDYARRRAEQLAELGYAAFAVDMYGGGALAEHPEDAQAFMMQVMGDMRTVRTRFDAALDVLHSAADVEPERTAAIGYCMGGAIVLQMARAGADLDAVASFHGSLGTETPASPGSIQPAVLVMTGADDPFVPAEQVAAFRSEMEAAGAAFELIEYPGAKHAFTNPGATAMGERFELPLRYDAAADADSWARMLELFENEL